MSRTTRVTTHHTGPTVPQDEAIRDGNTQDNEAREENESPVRGPGPDLEGTHAPDRDPDHHAAGGEAAEADTEAGPQKGGGKTVPTTGTSSVNSQEA